MTPDELMSAAIGLANASDEDIAQALGALHALCAKRARKAWEALLPVQDGAYSFDSTARSRARVLIELASGLEQAEGALRRFIAGRKCHACLLWPGGDHRTHTEEQSRERP